MIVHDTDMSRHQATYSFCHIISYHPVSKQVKSQTCVIKGCQIFEVINIM